MGGGMPAVLCTWHAVFQTTNVLTAPAPEPIQYQADHAYHAWHDECEIILQVQDKTHDQQHEVEREQRQTSVLEPCERPGLRPGIRLRLRHWFLPP